MKRIPYSGGGPGGAPTRAEIEREIIDRFLRRSLMRGGFDERRTVELALRFLDKKLLPELDRLLDRELGKLAAREGLGVESLQSARLKSMIAEVEKVVSSTYADLGAALATKAREIAVREGRAAATILERVFPADISFTRPSNRILEALVTKRPMQSKVLREHVKDLSAAAKRAITDQVRLGISVGEGVPKIKARILRHVAGKIDGPIPRQVRRQAEAIARTIPNYVANAATMETAKANKSLIKGWRWDSTLDARSCPFCASRDGQEFKLGDGIAAPPAHIGCRCRMGYIVSNDARKAAGWKDVDRSKFRRPSEGGPVKYGTKFEQWMSTQPKGFADRWMGKERAQIWRSGVPLKSLVDTRTMDFKPLVVARRAAARVGA